MVKYSNAVEDHFQNVINPNEWISVKENPPAIGQRVIAMDDFFHVVHSMVLMEDGWYFDYPNQKLNYRSNIIPMLWFPAPALPSNLTETEA